MVIYYESMVEAQYDLNIERLVQLVIESYEDTLDDGIIYYWGDNMEFFLFREGFEDYDNLTDDTIDNIYDTVRDKLEEIIKEL